MARSRIGLDMGSTAVRAVELTLGESPAVVHAAQVPLPPGAVENGEVKDPSAVAASLKELWQRGGFKQKRVYMGVGNQRVVVREIALPYMAEKELRASLGFQVQEFIPMPVDDAVLDYDPVGEFDQDGQRMLRLLLVAAQRGMVDQMVAAALEAKLEPVGLDLVPFAMVRAVGTPSNGMNLEEGGDEAIIDVGAHVTNIVVHAKGTTRFVRILPSGGRDITVAVARGLGVDDDAAERLKRGEPVDDVIPPTVEERPDPDHIRQIAMQRATSFVDEIRSSLEFYTAQSQGVQIERVIVTGGGSKLEGFLDLLRQRIPVQVDAGKVFQHVTHNLALSQEALDEAEPLLAVGVGLAIPGEGDVSQVNLLPKEILERQTIRRNTAVVALVGAFLLLGVVGLYLLEGNQLSSVNDQITAQNAENATVQAQIGKLQQYADLQTEAQQQQALLDSAWSGEVSFSGILMDVSRVIPADMDLTALNVTLTPPAAPGTGTTTTGATTFVGTIDMSGNALTPQTIASWLTRLEGVKGWANPWASDATLSEEGGPYALTTSVDLTTDAVTPRGSRGGTTSGG